MRIPLQVVKVTAASAALVLVGSGVSYAALSTSEPSLSSFDGANDSAVVASHANHKHGGQGGHLDAENLAMRLVGQMRVNQDQGGRVADVAVHDGHAYLTAFFEPNCQKGGVYVFDIRNPAAPKQINFIRTANNSYAGEGAQALEIRTPSFTGDLLVHNNEVCTGGGNQGGTDHSVGGISLVDVTNPKKAQVLASGFGDVQEGARRANAVHSAFAWQPEAGGPAYAVMVDNEESTDVDIVDISDPAKPVLIAEYDLDNGTKVVGGALQPSGIPAVADAVKGDSESFLHDMVVKSIGGRQVMLLSYWDGGYVKLDVTSPTAASYLADSDFAAIDQQLAEPAGGADQREPEGNAHQAEFSADNRWILAADEDFAPFSFTAKGARVGDFAANSGDGTPQLAEGAPLSAPTVFVGRACTGDAGVPTGDGTSFAVVERGVCTFTEKVANVAAAGGYEGVVVMNRQGSDACSDTLGMSVQGSIPTFGVVSREVGLRILGIAGYDEAACRKAAPQQSVSDPYTPAAPLGTKGDTLTFESYFDGWGYLRLFDNNSGKLVERDQFAIPEAHDRAFATGFGDLSVHEVAFSQKRPDLAYVSYYSGGTRVYDVSGGTIEEVGYHIAPGGSNMWGVDVFSMGGKEYVAASDRDFGVQIFEYTGPGGPNTP